MKQCVFIVTNYEKSAEFMVLLPLVECYFIYIQIYELATGVLNLFLLEIIYQATINLHRQHGLYIFITNKHACLFFNSTVICL